MFILDFIIIILKLFIILGLFILGKNGKIVTNRTLIEKEAVQKTATLYKRHPIKSQTIFLSVREMYMIVLMNSVCFNCLELC